MQACFLTCRMGCHGVNSRATGPTVPSSLWSVLGGSVGPPGGAGTGFSSVAGPGLGSTGGRFWEHTLLFALSAQLLELNRRTLGILLLPPVSGGCALMSPSPRLCFQVSRLPSVCVKSPPTRAPVLAWKVLLDGDISGYLPPSCLLPSQEKGESTGSRQNLVPSPSVICPSWLSTRCKPHLQT